MNYDIEAEELMMLSKSFIELINRQYAREILTKQEVNQLTVKKRDFIYSFEQRDIVRAQ